MGASHQLASFVAGTRYQDIEQPARDRAKLCVLDCIGVLLAGSTDDVAAPLLRFAAENNTGSDATLLGVGGRTDCATAALVNGAFSHALDYDDTNAIFIGHASACIVAAILALAERTRASGADIITAYMVGTEVQWRVGEALVSGGDHYRRGWHSSGTVGSFGATAAAGRLLGLSESQLVNALGITASLAGGVQQQFGTQCKPLQVGLANENGVRAALLARAGLGASPDALDGPVGFFSLVSSVHDLRRLENLAKPWGILETTFARGMNMKRHPVCGSSIGAFEGAMQLRESLSARLDQIVSIACGVRPESLNYLFFHRPTTTAQARFSVEYWVAATLIFGRLGLEQLTPDIVVRDDVQALISRIKVYPDPEITIERATVKITITLKDGRRLTSSYVPPKGAPDNPMSEEEILAKFEECAEWGGDRAAKQ